MKGRMVLAGLGLAMIVVSLTALADGTARMLDAQCTRRCNCGSGPCGAVTLCLDTTGVWTKCCTWCST